MKVLFLNTDIDYGGATNIMIWLADRLSATGNDVTFLTYRNAKEGRNVPKGVKHFHLQLESKGHSVCNLPRTLIRLHRYLKRGSFDVAIAFLPPSHLRLSLAAIFTRTKVLLSHRGDPYQNGGTRTLLSMIEYNAFKRADKYVFQTRQAMEYYGKSIQSRAIVIPNPVKPMSRTIKRQPDNRIVNVGRLDVRQKRQDLLINAFKLISSDYPDVTLHFYGDGDDEKTLREQAKGNDRIFFNGVTNDVVKDIQNARMFVLSSDFEGIPNALIEAMSLGVPCISTKCSPGGAELLINNEINGLLSPCGDALLLSKKIRLFLDNPVFSENCGKEAMKIIDTFSEEKIFMSWSKFISNTDS